MKAVYRLAWREMTQHKIRSLIGILIVALPIALISMGICTLWIHLRPLSDPAIQAVVSQSAMTPVQQDYRGTWTTYPEEPLPSASHNFSALSTESLEEIVAPNNVLPVFETTVFTTADHSAHSIAVAQFDGTAVPGYLGIVEGKAPNTGEIVLNGKKAHDMGVSIGDSFEISAQNFSTRVRVCGLSSSDRRSFIGVDTINFDAAKNTHQNHTNSAQPYNSDAVEYSWIVTGNEPVTWDHIKKINKQGSTVISAWGKKNPPVDEQFYPNIDNNAFSYILEIQMLLTYAVALILVLLVLILMLTPVFTISAHRMRRSLAHVLMNGGEAKHIRSIVLIHGVLIGISGGLLGSATGLGTLVCLNGSYILRVPWIVTITFSISLIGFIFGIMAALIPALQAARLSPIAAVKARTGAAQNLTMHPTVHKPSAFTFFALFISGTLILMLSTIAAQSIEDPIVTAISTLIFPLAVLAEIVGAIGMVPSIIWIVSTKLHLRGIAKIAMRDLLRSTHRTVPAIGAFVGVLIGVTMILSFLSLTQRNEADLAFGGRGPVGSLRIQPEHNRSATDNSSVTALKKATNDYIDRFGSAKNLDFFSLPGYTSTLHLYVQAQTVTDLSTRTCFTLSTHDFPAEGQGSHAPFSEGTCTNSSWIPLSVNIVDNIEALIRYAGWEGTEAQRARDMWQRDGIIDVSAIFKPSHTDFLPAIPAIETWSSASKPSNPYEHIRALTQETLHTATLSNKNNTFFKDVIISAKTAQQWGINYTISERTLIFDQPLQPKDSWTVSRIAHRYDSILQISANQRTFIDAYGSQITIAIVLSGLFIFTLFVMAIASEEMRGDYATLYAVGASPRALSSLSAVQGAAMGIIALIGIPAGLLPILTIQHERLPWLFFALMAVLTPCVTSIAAAFTRPRHLNLAQRYE